MKVLYLLYFLYFGTCSFIKMSYLRKYIFGAKRSFDYFKELAFIMDFSLLALSANYPYVLGMYFILDFIITVFIITSLMYFKYFNRLPTIHNLSSLNQVTSIARQTMDLFSKRYLWLFSSFALYPVLLALSIYKCFDYFAGRWMLYPVLALSSAYILYSLCTYIKLNVKRDNDLIPFKIGIFAYELFEIGTFLLRMKLKPGFVTKEEVDKAKCSQKNESIRLFGSAKDKNLIVIQVEALQQFPLFLEVGGREVTPFLNSLSKECICFDNFYSQVGPGNTSDAEMMLNMSVYPTEYSAAMQKYSNREVRSLPHLIKERGYESAAFHTNKIQFWNRDRMYDTMGFDYFYEKSFFGDEDIVGMGASDGVLFKKGLDIIYDFVANKQKFYASFITLSSHYTFNINRGEVKLPEELRWVENTLLYDYLRSINYVDNAIREFVERLEFLGILDESVLVIYGDHFGINHKYFEDEKLKDAVESIIQREYRLEDTFKVPCLMRLPYGEVRENVKAAAGQIDLMPIISNLLGISLDDFVHFGCDALNAEDNAVGIRYHLPGGSFAKQDKIYLKKDLSDNDSNLSVLANKIKDLERLSDSYLDSLPKIKK